MHADSSTGGGPPGAFRALHRSPPGDPRGSSQNDLTAEFLGDYVYAVATRTYGAAVWNDTRNAADCPAIDTWRASLESGPPGARPAPQQDCPSNVRQLGHLRRLLSGPDTLIEGRGGRWFAAVRPPLPLPPGSTP